MTCMTSQRRNAQLFHSLHDSAAPLTLANVWDVASARLVAATGAAAIATTSAGVAWALGAADGNLLDRDDAIGLIEWVVRAVPVPVSADIESGYGATAAEVADTVSQVVAAGAVGINIEDALTSGTSALRPAAEQSVRIGAARAAADKAGIPLFINARIDTYLGAVGPAESRLQDTLDRARAYLDAGASGIFVPGVTDADVIAALTAGIPAPVNVLAGPGALSVDELAELGVARVSLGSAVAQTAYDVVRRAATELLSTGTYGGLTDAVDYAELNDLMCR